MKLTKITFDLRDETGQKYRRTLQDEDAEKWYEWIVFLCECADEAAINPDWLALNWSIRKLKSDTIKVLECSRVLEEILEQMLKENPEK